MEKVKISSEYIRLDNLLKLKGAVATGGHAKIVIQNGKVYVDDEICTLRGKKLRKGNTVRFNSYSFIIE